MRLSSTKENSLPEKPDNKDMDILAAIAKPVEEEMQAFNSLFKEVLHGHSKDFQFMIDYVSESDGKKIRPLIVLLSAKACNQINEKTMNYAVVLELLHSATLIHDDVVDNTKERRGRPSINAKYDNRFAVLLGDYFLSIAIVRAAMSQSLPIIETISRLALYLADGELSQLTHSWDVLMDEKAYFEIIRKKTAVLFSACAEMGALSASAHIDMIEKMRLFGEYAGMCFQIKDDIFDFFEQGELGKPTGNDIKEGKITLPLIYALNKVSLDKTALLRDMIKNQDFKEENIHTLIDFAIHNHGIAYAQEKMQEIKQKALHLLEDFPDTEAKKSLCDLIEYIIERNK